MGKLTPDSLKIAIDKANLAIEKSGVYGRLRQIENRLEAGARKIEAVRARNPEDDRLAPAEAKMAELRQERGQLTTEFVIPHFTLQMLWYIARASGEWPARGTVRLAFPGLIDHEMDIGDAEVPF